MLVLTELLFSGFNLKSTHPTANPVNIPIVIMINISFKKNDLDRINKVSDEIKPSIVLINSVIAFEFVLGKTKNSIANAYNTDCQLMSM